MSLRRNLHEPLLKEDLGCWECRKTFKTMPLLKEHLTRRKEAEASTHTKQAPQEKKREGPEGYADDGREPSSARREVTLDAHT